jgi:ABC-type glutathione transport system ATPase component
MNGAGPVGSTERRDPLLDVADLHVSFSDGEGARTEAVSGVSLHVDPGELLAVVGESGAGKSSLLLAVLGLLGADAYVQGSVRLEGRELAGAASAELREVRGRAAALVPQEPTAALDPLMRVGAQVVEQLRAHRDLTRRAARERALEALVQAGLDDAERVSHAYPHELSGGMRQRVLIAMALSCQPRLLLCDEPTSGLDATVEARLLDLLDRLRRARRLGVLLVTHDLAVARRVADRVAVMRSGRVLEQGTIDRVFDAPQRAYTRELIAAVPWIDVEPGPATVSSSDRPSKLSEAMA